MQNNLMNSYSDLDMLVFFKRGPPQRSLAFHSRKKAEGGKRPQGCL